MMVGDIVLIIDTDTARNDWPLGRVIDVIKGDDDLVRRVKVQVGTHNLDSKGRRKGNLSILERPIQKLVLVLEADSMQ